MADDGSREVMNIVMTAISATASVAAILAVYAASKINNIELKDGIGEVDVKSLVKGLNKNETLNYREFTAEEYDVFKNTYITKKCGVRNFSCMRGTDGKVLVLYGSDDIGAMDHVQQAVEGALGARSEMSNKAFIALASDHEMCVFSDLSRSDVEILRQTVHQLPYTVVKPHGSDTLTVVCCEEDAQRMRDGIALAAHYQTSKRLFGSSKGIIKEELLEHNHRVRVENRERLFKAKAGSSFIDAEHPGDRIDVLKDRFVVYFEGKQIASLEKKQENMQLAYSTLEKMSSPAIVALEDINRLSPSELKEFLQEHPEFVEELEPEINVKVDINKLKEEQSKFPQIGRDKVEQTKPRATPFYPPVEEKQENYMPNLKVSVKGEER